MDDHEYELKQVDLTLKEREVAAREREVAAKEKEPQATSWKSTVIVGLVVAAIGVIGSIYTEHIRAQSSLVLSSIRTNGSEDDTCKNLYFFVRLGLLDDPHDAIKNTCGAKGENGIPTLPASSAAGDSGTGYGTGGYGLNGLSFGINTLTVRVDDADSHVPIANAKVDLEQPPLPSFLQQQTPILGQPQENKVIQSTNTGATGDAILNFVSSFQSLTVSKDGYESVTRPMSQSGLFGYPSSAMEIIDLHRIPKSKH